MILFVASRQAEIVKIPAMWEKAVLSGPRHPKESWVSEIPMHNRRVEIILTGFLYACFLQVIEDDVECPDNTG